MCDTSIALCIVQIDDLRSKLGEVNVAIYEASLPNSHVKQDQRKHGRHEETRLFPETFVVWGTSGHLSYVLNHSTSERKQSKAQLQTNFEKERRTGQLEMALLIT